MNRDRYIRLLMDLGKVGILYSLKNPTPDMPLWAIDCHYTALNRLRIRSEWRMREASGEAIRCST